MIDKDKLKIELDVINARTKEIQRMLDEPEIILWEPKGGGYTVFGNRDIKEFNTTDDYRLNGTEYKNLEQATKAAKLMREHNRQIAFFMEHCPDYKPNWNDKREDKYFSFYSYEYNKFDFGADRFIKDDCKLYFPEKTIKLYCKMRNSGELVL